ncbi:MAG: tetraacyldisaccharide 4'-kinase [Mariprofundaceae bacterium]|nr:tetraacyldisaccharide 4'-kinase [Mariprofundaceae bacterium]
MNLARRIEAMWWGKSTPPALLRWLSHAYAAINKRNLARRKSRAIEPSVPLISVGNITVGGSGKTPFVIWLCGELLQRDYQPVILCRGDGGNLKQPKRIACDDSACEIGDEALLLAQSCDVPVIAGRDRIAGCRMAAELGDVIILDDGFQYRQLKRHCDIVLIPDAGIGNAYQLPAGPLREPLSALQRADLIVRSGGDDENKIVPLPLHEKTIRQWTWRSKIQPIHQICGPETAKPEYCLAVAAIARPQRFIHSAAQVVSVEKEMLFADHHRYTADDISRMLTCRLPVLCTEKDAVKILPLWPEKQPLWVLPIVGESEQGLPQAIIKTMLSHRK